MSSAGRETSGDAGDLTVDAILLAGGRGTRLYPYTAVLPKPLMPLGDRPVLEILLHRLRAQGLRNLVLCTGHFAELLKAFFGDGERFGVKLRYTHENQPLGTAGPIALVHTLGEPFVVMNGDLLTTLDFRALLAEHGARGADVTIAAYPREVKIDFGVLNVTDDGLLDHYQEKPTYNFLVSMGVYAFKRWTADLIKPGEHVDIPEFVERIKKNGGRVACFQSSCFWLDIGRPEDYARAQDEFERNPTMFLGGGKDEHGSG